MKWIYRNVGLQCKKEEGLIETLNPVKSMCIFIEIWVNMWSLKLEYYNKPVKHIFNTEMCTFCIKHI